MEPRELLAYLARPVPQGKQAVRELRALPDLREPRERWGPAVLPALLVILVITAQRVLLGLLALLAIPVLLAVTALLVIPALLGVQGPRDQPAHKGARE